VMASAGINAVRVPVGYWVLATSQVSVCRNSVPLLLSRVGVPPFGTQSWVLSAIVFCTGTTISRNLCVSTHISADNAVLV